MNIDTNGWSTSDVLKASWRLVASSESIIACGCSLDQDELDSALDLAIICKDYLKAYDQRFT